MSDLHRTVQTAGFVADFHHDVPFYLDRRLREKGGGEIEGKPLATSKKNAEKAGIPNREYKAPGGESWIDVMERANSFLKELVDGLCRGKERKLQPYDIFGDDKFLFKDSHLEAGEGKPPKEEKKKEEDQEEEKVS